MIVLYFIDKGNGLKERSFLLILRLEVLELGFEPGSDSGALVLNHSLYTPSTTGSRGTCREVDVSEPGFIGFQLIEAVTSFTDIVK